MHLLTNAYMYKNQKTTKINWQGKYPIVDGLIGNGVM